MFRIAPGQAWVNSTGGQSLLLCEAPPGERVRPDSYAELGPRRGCWTRSFGLDLSEKRTMATSVPDRPLWLSSTWKFF
jgi:hypothetical protein